MAVAAVRHFRRMRGGAQGHLMLCADDHLYVVKFQNNPQHLRVLANELIATRLAGTVGLTVPTCEVIDVSAQLIAETPDLDIDFGRRRERCKPGLQFGSRLVGGLMPGNMMDYLPENVLLEVKNLREFAGILALDKWTGNSDGRQAVFTRKRHGERYVANFIDQGYCFNAGMWQFADAPLKGIYARNAVYTDITGWQDFSPWLQRIEGITPAIIWEIAKAVPPEWRGGGAEVLEALIERLIERQARVRELIRDFRQSDRLPFPKWLEGCNLSPKVSNSRSRSSLLM